MKRIFKGINGVIDVIGGSMILVMTVIVILQVVLRYVFNAPLTWSEELARYLFIYITFLGGSVLLYERSHLFVEVVFNALPTSAKRLVQLLIDLIVCGFSAYTAYSGIFLMETASGSFSTAMGIPMQYISASVGIGAVLMCLFSLYNIGRDILAVTGGGDTAPGENSGGEGER